MNILPSPQGQNSLLEPLELELGMILRILWILGTWTQILYRNYLADSPAQKEITGNVPTSFAGENVL